MASTPQSTNRRHRLEMRVSPEQEALIREAADLADETLTGFVLGTATERARTLIDARRTVTLPNEAFDRFYEALDQPAKVVPELVDLLRAKPLARD